MSAQEQLGIVSDLSPNSPSRRIALIGSPDRAGWLANRLVGRGSFPVQIVRVLDPSDEDHENCLDRLLNPDLLHRQQIWGIIVDSGNAHKVPTSTLLRCRLNGIHVFDEASFWERAERCIDVDSAGASWLLAGDGFRHGWVDNLTKRLLDLLVTGLLIVLTSPLMILVAALIRFESRGPILYRQERIGWHGRPFILFKFRSMRTDAEPTGIPVWAAERDSRVTRIGRFIRYTRIDELPQLWNVLRGEMSLVGPRPERAYFVERLAATIPFYAERHAVKPGITGWAQINAPYGASSEDAREKLRYDLYYIKNRRLWLDVWILLRTIRVILFQEGAR